MDASLAIAVRSVGAIIRLPRTRFLFQLRDDIAGIVMPGRWGLFGGHVDAGEDFEPAIVRELEEELGLVGRPVRMASELAFPRAGAWIHRKLFDVTITDDDLARLVLREGASMRAMTAHEFLALDRIVYWDAFALAQVLAEETA